jgi:hypothetical protein
MRPAAWGTIAGVVWKPTKLNVRLVERLVPRVSCGMDWATGAGFNPDSTATAELHYWDVPRQRSGQMNFSSFSCPVAARQTPPWSLKQG